MYYFALCGIILMLRLDTATIILSEKDARGGISMPEVKVREGESLDSALRRFKRTCARSAILAELRKREHYEKPSVKRKKKSEAARKRKYK